MNDSVQWWLEPGFIAFDTETTGTDPSVDRIVSAAAVRFVSGAPVEEHTWLLRIDVPIPAASTSVHGITDEMSQRDGVPQAQALVELRDYLGGSGLPVVAFNASFDMQMLSAGLTRLGASDVGDLAVICPYVLDKQFNKYVRGRNQRRLMPTIERYGLTLHEDDWHGALADAVVTGELLLAEFAAYDALRGYSSAELAAQVIAWRAEQEAEFQAWLAARQRESGA